jgi:transposase
MTTMPQPAPTQVTVGVDTHAEVHVAVATDGLGRRLDTTSVPTTPAGYAALLGWAQGLGQVDAWGIEGTGSFGAGLTRFLRSRGQVVVEVNRPDRQARRRRPPGRRGRRPGRPGPPGQRPQGRRWAGGAGPLAAGGPGHRHEGPHPAINALKGLLVTAPAELREPRRGLSTVRLVQTAAALELGPVITPLAAARRGLRSLAGRYQALSAELAVLDAELDRLTNMAAPKLVTLVGVGSDSAGALLVAAGDNPDRRRADAAFSMLCGSSPIQASSGKTRRHRLTRGGDRQANAALHRIVVARLRHDQQTRDYLARRIREGKSKKEAIRCLKRYVAREVFAVLPR